jgi:hypothetical protein
MYVILAGSVRLVEIEVVLGPGALVGEMGIFAPDHRRTGTALCETEVEIGSISDEKALQLYYQNPAFGFSLFRLVMHITRTSGADVPEVGSRRDGLAAEGARAMGQCGRWRGRGRRHVRRVPGRARPAVGAAAQTTAGAGPLSRRWAIRRPRRSSGCRKPLLPW